LLALLCGLVRALDYAFDDPSLLERREYANNYIDYQLSKKDDDSNGDNEADDNKTDKEDSKKDEQDVPIALGPPSRSLTTVPASTTDITEFVPVRYVIQAGEYHVYKLNASNAINGTKINFYATGNLCGVPSWDASKGRAMRIQLATNLTDLTTNNRSEAFYSYFNRGFSNITISNMNASASANSTAYLMVMAPKLEQINITQGTGLNTNETWTYELAISTQSAIHRYYESPNLYLVDTDFANALLVSGNLTTNNNRSVSANAPFMTNASTYYSIHVFQSQSSQAVSAIDLDRSYCAVQTSPRVLLDTLNAQVSHTTRGAGGYEKLQYFLSGLNKSTSYVAYLSEPFNRSNTAQGGALFGGVNFTSKAETNCQIIYDLDLCSDVAFAVPGNASVYSAKELSAAYDDYARNLYDAFNTSMQVIQCGDDVDDADRYSILRSCDDCRESYRQWLCATTIPRCTDSTINKSFLFYRDANSSRTDFINNVIQPGPYNEVLPCIDLCYGIMQDCPSSFGFVCPKQGLPGFDGAYYLKEGSGSDVTCNYPGVVYTPNNAARVSGALMWTSMTMALFIFMFVF
jgi:calcium channel MID1